MAASLNPDPANGSMERKWLNMATESFAAAESLLAEGRLRSCVSRAYYAMYQSTQAILLRAGQEPPDRGNWNHRKTVESLDGIGRSQLRRLGVQILPMLQKFTRVQELRAHADYGPTRPFETRAVRDALRFAGQFLHMARKVSEI